MAIAANIVQKAYVAFFNRPADYAGLLYWSTNFTGTSLDSLLNTLSTSQEYTNLYSGLNNTAIVNQIYQNLFKRDADLPGLSHWLTKLDNKTLTLASIANGIAEGAQNDDKVAFANKVTAAVAYTNALDTPTKVQNYASSTTASMAATKAWLAAITTDATLTAATTTAALSTIVTATTSTSSASTTTTGATFTLSTGVDTGTYTTGNDTIIGDFTTTATINAADQINGLAGTDTLKLYGAITPALITSNLSSAITNVEVLQFAGIPTDAAVDLTSFTKATTGIENIIFDNISLLNADSITTTTGQSVSLSTGSAGTVVAGTVTWAASAVDTSLNLTLNGYQGVVGGTALALTVTGAAATTLNIVSSGTAIAGSAATNQISTLTTQTAATSVVITGTASLQIGTSLTGASIATVNASAASGGVDINVAAATAAALTFTGGAGNDIVRFAAGSFSSADVVNLGAGTNTLYLLDTALGGSGTAALNAAVNAVTTAQYIGIAGAATVDMSGVTATTVTLGAGNNTVIQKLESTDFVRVEGVTAGTINATASLGYNTLNLQLVGTGEAVAATGVLTATSQANINIASSTTGTATTANTIANITNSANAVITVTGSQAVTLGTLAAAASVNAANATGVLTVTGADAASSFTGGSKADVLTGATAAGGDTFVGGAGDDTINTGAQTGTTATVITGGTGADAINLQGTGANAKVYTINATAAQSYATAGQFDTVTMSNNAAQAAANTITLVTGISSSTVTGATAVVLGTTTVTASSFLAVGSASATLTATDQIFQIYQDTNGNGIIEATDLRIDFTDGAATDTMAISIVGGQIVVTDAGV